MPKLKEVKADLELANPELVEAMCAARAQYWRVCDLSDVKPAKMWKKVWEDYRDEILRRMTNGRP